ncbi:hypothetical protein GN244_ATG09076 [Phytophthora infestans]|uniref:Uncharacterized protein n=1 Tax=Phytophthora infestans TaxID=4787 RepID=A0A833TCM0_PHYIN|nr:hypothetical protein GN244_ATG09076 [Phytophthora infestans]
MANKVELNKNGRSIGWQGQCWTYDKSIMEFAFADKEVLPNVKEDATFASGANDADNNKFNILQMKAEHIIMASLSMKLGQQGMIKMHGTEM